MKKPFLKIALLSAFTMVLSSCGGWSQEDKDKLQETLDAIRPTIEYAMGDKTDAYLDCYSEKVQENYDSFEEADNDAPGCAKLATECAEEVMAD